MCDEIWQTIPSIPAYQVSNMGSVRSLISRFGVRKVPLLIAQAVSNSGYLRVNLRQDGDHRHYAVHRLVLLAFIGEPPEGFEACHGPRGKLCNELTNLRWGTKEDNYQDRDRDGNIRMGETHGMAKLTDDMVREIRRRRPAETQRKIASELGVSRHTISLVERGRIWKHVT